jgi:cell division protein FtsB
MIIITASALCVSVYVRARSELSSAVAKHEAAQVRVDELRIEVDRRKREVEQLKTDDREIEKLARLKFGFVRKGDVVIKLSEEKKEGISEQVATLTPQGTKAYTKASN